MEAEASSSDGDGSNEEMARRYEVNSMILCSHTDNLYYEAKIIAREEQPDGNYVYTVHYQGWSKRYDEHIPESRTASRFRPFTPENILTAKIEMKEAKARAAELLAKKKRPQKAEIRRGRPPLHLSESPRPKDRRRVVKMSETLTNKVPFSRSSPSICEAEASSVPAKLKNILEKDRYLVENELKLPTLPGRFSVSKILKEYVLHVRKLDAVCSEVKVHKGRARYWKGVVAALDECADNIKSFFDLVIASDVLYPNEQLRHRDLTEGTSEVTQIHGIADLLNEPERGLCASSDCYGFIYLLRLLIRFPEMIDCMLCDSDSREILTAFVQSFIRYLGNNAEKFFDSEGDYESVSEEYKQRLLQSPDI